MSNIHTITREEAIEIHALGKPTGKFIVKCGEIGFEAIENKDGHVFSDFFIDRNEAVEWLGGEYPTILGIEDATPTETVESLTAKVNSLVVEKFDLLQSNTLKDKQLTGMHTRLAEMSQQLFDENQQVLYYKNLNAKLSHEYDQRTFEKVLA
jgi:hypothetical protein